MSASEQISAGEQVSADEQVSTGEHNLLSLVGGVLQRLREQPEPATFGLLQVANFSAVRQWVGKPDAEILLTRLAASVQVQLPEGCQLLRCHNYEFALLFFKQSSLNAHTICTALQEHLKHAVKDALPEHLHIDCAIGLVKLDPELVDANIVVAQARRKLRRDQNDSGGLIAAAPRPQHRLLQEVLAQRQIQAALQPVPAFSSGQRRLFTLSTRAALPDAELPTANLFRLALENGMAETLDRLVVEMALETLSETPAEASILVKLSMGSLVSATFLEFVKQQAESHPTLMPRLIFQLDQADVLICQHYMIDFSEVCIAHEINLCMSHALAIDESESLFNLLPLWAVSLDIPDYNLPEAPDWEQNEQHKHHNKGKTSDPANLKNQVRTLHNHDLLVIANRVNDIEQLPILWHSGIDFVRGDIICPPRHQPDYIFPQRVKWP